MRTNQIKSTLCVYVSADKLKGIFVFGSKQKLLFKCAI